MKEKYKTQATSGYTMINNIQKIEITNIAYIIYCLNNE